MVIAHYAQYTITYHMFSVGKRWGVCCFHIIIFPAICTRCLCPTYYIITVCNTLLVLPHFRCILCVRHVCITEQNPMSNRKISCVEFNIQFVGHREKCRSHLCVYLAVMCVSAYVCTICTLHLQMGKKL